MPEQLTNGQVDRPAWTIDVQRGLAWTVIIVFGCLLVALAMRVIVSGLPTDALELLKQGFNALINIAMMVMGFFFGSSKSSQTKDDTQAKVAEKLADKLSPAAPAPMIPTVTTTTTDDATVTKTEPPQPAA